MTASCRQENALILICYSASERKLSLMCIFKRQDILDSWFNQGDHNEIAYAASDWELIESDFFTIGFLRFFFLIS